MITVDQITAARKLLGLSYSRLAARVSLSTNTIRRIEGKGSPIEPTRETMATIQTFLESAGVILVDDDSAGPRVKLREATITPDEIKTARKLLCWSVPKLAERAKLSNDMVRRAENSALLPRNAAHFLGCIKRAFEAGGVEFQGGKATIVLRSSEGEQDRAAKRPTGVGK